MHILKVEAVSKRVSGDFILHDVSFSQKKRQNIAIAGETGSGKSTLLRIIAGFEQPDSGEIYLSDRQLRGPNYQLIPGHEGVAYLSQYFELRNWYRVKELLDMANKVSDEEAANIYELCRIAHLLQRRTDHLSGGEKQRIALARLLVTAPELLILDEPFSNMDMIHKNVLREVIRDVSGHMDISCIITAHDPFDILPWADELIIMRHGSVVQQGAPKDIYQKPNDEYVAGILGSYNKVEGSLAQKLGVEDMQDDFVIIRPEALKVSKHADRGVKSTVTNIRYFGSYYELSVNTDGQELLVHTHEDNYFTGQELNISLR